MILGVNVIYWSKSFVLFEEADYFEVVDTYTGEVVMEVFKWY